MEFPLIYLGKWKWERQYYRLGHSCWQEAVERDSSQSFANLLYKTYQDVPFLTTASQIFSLAPIYFSNPILKQNAFSIIPQCPCGRCLPHGRDHTFTSLFTRNQLPTMQVKKKRISSESKHSEKLKHRISFFSDTSHPFPVCLTQSLRAREITGSAQKKQQSPPCAPSSKYILLVLGYHKGLEGSRAGSLWLQERAVKHGLTWPGKGKCTMNCSAAPA